MTYAPRILSAPGDLDSVRVMSGLNDRQLPDSAILSAALLPAIESKIIIAIPTWQSLSGDHRHILRSAATKRTAAIAILSLPESEKSLDYEVTRKRDEAASILLSESEEEINLIADAIDAGPEGVGADLLRLAGPTRSGRNRGAKWNYVN